MTEPTRQELEALGNTILGKEVQMKCRECKDPASYYVLSHVLGIMPWYYCPSCVHQFRRLGHVATFRLLHGMKGLSHESE